MSATKLKMTKMLKKAIFREAAFVPRERALATHRMRKPLPPKVIISNIMVGMRERIKTS